MFLCFKAARIESDDDDDIIPATPTPVDKNATKNSTKNARGGRAKKMTKKTYQVKILLHGHNLNICTVGIGIIRKPDVFEIRF